MIAVDCATLDDNFINRRLAQDFKLHGHLIRALITDAIRGSRSDAVWAAQFMLGHTDRTQQETYRADFEERHAVAVVGELVNSLDDPDQNSA